MSELPKFRRLEDVQRFLDEMYEEVDTSGKLVQEQQQMLAKLQCPTPKLIAMLSAAVEFDVTPDRSKSSTLRKMKTAIDPTLKKIVVPNLAKLKDQYGLMEDLYQKHTTLDSIATQIAMQFPDRRGPLYEKAVGSINELKSKVETQLKTVFEFLSNIAEKHVPKEFQTYVEGVQEKISEHVYFEDSQRYLYVSVKAGTAHPQGLKKTKGENIVFTEYMLLADSVNDEGKIAPQLYIVVQWIVGEGVAVYVEHEFTPPNQLSGGTEATTVQGAATAIAHLLELEGFASYMGTMPMSLQLKVAPELLKPSMFDGRNYIDQIAVDQDKITFKLKHHQTTPEVKKQIGLAIYPQLKALMKTRNAKLRMDLKPKGAIVFFIGAPAEHGQVSTHDVDFLKDRFGLTDQAVSKISQIISG